MTGPTETALAKAAAKERRAPNGSRLPEEYRRKYLPGQLIAARQRVIMLEREAERLSVDTSVDTPGPDAASIIRMAAQGHDTASIARELGLSSMTVALVLQAVEV